MRSRLLIESCDENYTKFHRLSAPIHKEYAERCDADRWFFLGRADPHVHPAWNRIRMIVDAFDVGYEWVCWLDSDELVVDRRVNIFEHVNAAHNLWLIATGVGWPYLDLEHQGPHHMWNDGTMLAHRSTRDLFAWLWHQRHREPAPHHIDAMWELNWLLDAIHGYEPDVRSHLADVAELHERFGWRDVSDAIPEDRATIKAFNGIEHERRWEMYQAAYRKAWSSR